MYRSSGIFLIPIKERFETNRSTKKKSSTHKKSKTTTRKSSKKNQSKSNKNKLTKTYKKTLRYLKDGLSIKEIADERDYQTSTIERHIKKLRKHNKLNDVTVEDRSGESNKKNKDLYDWQKKLIEENLDYYESLESGEKEPKTKEQKHFVKVLRGDEEPLTKHEFAYMRYKELGMKIDTKETEQHRSGSSKNLDNKSSHQISYEMYENGKTIGKIADERDLKETTIKGHLVNHVKKGQLSAEEFVDSDRKKIIKNLLKSDKVENVQDVYLSDLKEELPDNITYDEIKFVIAEYH